MTSRQIRSIAILFISVFCFYTAVSGQNTRFPAVITNLSGTVQLQLDNSGKWVNAKPGVGLKEGDSIKTADKSSAVIIIEDGSILQLEENTTVKISSLIPKISKLNKKYSAILEVINKGILFLSADKKYKADIKVNTPVCTVAIRGTSLSIDVPDETKTKVIMYEGKIIVKDFVTETVLPTEGNELMLAFLHEITLKANQEVTVTQKGIDKPKTTAKNTVTSNKEKIKELDAELQAKQKDNASKSEEGLQKERESIREGVLSGK